MKVAFLSVVAGAMMLAAPVASQTGPMRYDMAKTPVARLMKDPRAWEIVTRHAPMLRSDNPDAAVRELVDQGGDMTLKEIQVATKAYAGVGAEITDKMLSEIDAEFRATDFGIASVK